MKTGPLNESELEYGQGKSGCVRAGWLIDGGAQFTL